jgi:hypothetical protein
MLAINFIKNFHLLGEDFHYDGIVKENLGHRRNGKGPHECRNKHEENVVSNFSYSDAVDIPIPNRKNRDKIVV